MTNEAAARRRVARDAGGCVRLYTRAAERGFADAQCNLGWCYGTGFGVPRNYSSALRWYGKATALGHALAEHNFDVALREFDAQLSRRALPLELMEDGADPGGGGVS